MNDDERRAVTSARHLAWRHRTGRCRPMAEYKALRGGRKHGLRSTYTHGCRCAACRKAEADYRRAYRARATAA